MDNQIEGPSSLSIQWESDGNPPLNDTVVTGLAGTCGNFIKHNSPHPPPTPLPPPPPNKKNKYIPSPLPPSHPPPPNPGEPPIVPWLWQVVWAAAREPSLLAGADPRAEHGPGARGPGAAAGSAAQGAGRFGSLRAASGRSVGGGGRAKAMKASKSFFMFILLLFYFEGKRNGGHHLGGVCSPTHSGGAPSKVIKRVP